MPGTGQRSVSPGSGRGSQVTRWPLAWNERVPTQSGGGVGVWSEPRRQERHPEWWRQGRFVLIRPDTQASACLVTQWSFKKHLSERQGGRKSCPRLVHPPKAHRGWGGASRSPEPGAPPRSPTWGGAQSLHQRCPSQGLHWQEAGVGAGLGGSPGAPLWDAGILLGS